MFSLYCNSIFRKVCIICVTQGIEINFKVRLYKINRYGAVCILYMYPALLFPWRNSQTVDQAASLLKFLDHTHTHTHTHTHGRTHPNGSSALRRGHCLHHTEQTQQTNIHVLSGIGTRVSSNRAAEDLRLRPHYHGYQPSLLMAMKCFSTGLYPRLF